MFILHIDRVVTIESLLTWVATLGQYLSLNKFESRLDNTVVFDIFPEVFCCSYPYNVFCQGAVYHARRLGIFKKTGGYNFVLPALVVLKNLPVFWTI